MSMKSSEEDMDEVDEGSRPCLELAGDDGDCKDVALEGNFEK